MKIARNLRILLIIVVGTLLIYAIYIHQTSNTEIVSSNNLGTLDNSLDNSVEVSTVDFTFDVLQAMHYYYFSTQGQTAAGEEASTILVNMMSSMMDSIRRLESGNRILEPYLNSDEEIVELVANGMTAGANRAIEAEEEFVDYLKKVDELEPSTYSDLEYQLAKRNSGEKEGYSTIAISAAQIGYLFFEPAESENPSGPVPYKISKQQRESILKEIDILFGEELKEYENSTGDVNTIIFGVNSIKNQLVPDTYEEAQKLDF